MNRRAALSILMAALVFIAPSSALAHKVSVYAWVEGSSAQAEAYFADGTRCRGCEVEVLDAKTGERLAQGKTDAEGLFAFDAPHAAVRVVVQAGPGHMGQYTLELEEAAQVQETAPEQKPASEEIAGAEAQRRIDDLTKELMRLREESQRPGATEIVGGIGWIVGILGFIAYLKSRKK